jgi:hypothetical protein
MILLAVTGSFARRSRCSLWFLRILLNGFCSFSMIGCGSRIRVVTAIRHGSLACNDALTVTIHFRIGREVFLGMSGPDPYRTTAGVMFSPPAAASQSPSVVRLVTLPPGCRRPVRFARHEYRVFGHVIAQRPLRYAVPKSRLGSRNNHHTFGLIIARESNTI